MSLRVQLDRESLVYRPGETVTGRVEVSNLNNVAHAGLHVALNGTLHLVPPKELNRPEQVSKLIHKSKQLLTPGKILGNTEIDFSLQLIADNNEELNETYHGKTVAIEYVVTADLTRTGFAKSLRTSVDFILQNPKGSQQEEEEGGTRENFVIEDIGGVKDSRIKGHLESSVIDLQRPILGELEIESAPAIDSIDLQVVRQEKITTPEINTENASDAQVCEIVSGNIERHVKVPIYCLLQKFVVAPSISNDKFKLAFMLRILIKYKDDLSKSVREYYKDIPIKFVRS